MWQAAQNKRQKLLVQSVFNMGMYFSLIDYEGTVISINLKTLIKAKIALIVGLPV